MKRIYVSCAAALLVLSGCVRASGAPVTSADESTGPVPMRWALNDSPRPDGSQLRLQGGTMHAIPKTVKLLDAAGQEISQAVADFQPGASLCGAEDPGLTRADVPLPPAEVPGFRPGWPTGYRVEVNVAGTWYPADLTSAGCTTTE
jgi:hypothetical protein